LIALAMIRLRRARAFMCGHQLRVFKRAAGYDLGGLLPA
jgi:hypothetical protein